MLPKLTSLVAHFSVLPAAVFLVSCDFLGSKSCPADVRFTPCVTINGSDSIDSQYTLYRSFNGVIDYPETFGSGEPSRCFIERTGEMTIFVTRSDSLVAQKKITVREEADGCHAERVTVDFEIAE